MSAAKTRARKGAVAPTVMRHVSSVGGAGSGGEGVKVLVEEGSGVKMLVPGGL